LTWHVRDQDPRRGAGRIRLVQVHHAEHVPKPVCVWVRESDGLHALVHRGRVDVSHDGECVLESDEMTALADLSNDPAVHDDPVTTQTSVHVLVWKRREYDVRVRCLDIEAGDLRDVLMGWDDGVTAIHLLDECGQFGTEDDRLPVGRGLWLWVGTATSISRSGDPDEIRLDGKWVRPSADSVGLGSGG
jgi:hypothetical protein